MDSKSPPLKIMCRNKPTVPVNPPLNSHLDRSTERPPAISQQILCPLGTESTRAGLGQLGGRAGARHVIIRFGCLRNAEIAGPQPVKMELRGGRTPSREPSWDYFASAGEPATMSFLS